MPWEGGKQNKVSGFDNYHEEIKEIEEDLLMGFDENAINDILASIAAFQEQ